MALHEVYRLAHTAECRLNLSAARPDRNLRFVVGHLMHYESLRLRIVEIEHDIDKKQRAAQRRLDRRPSSELALDNNASLAKSDVDDVADDLTEYIEDAGGMDDALGLTRFPSGGGSRPPALMADEEDDIDEAPEPVSPEELNEVTIEQTLERPADSELVKSFENIRDCPCHGHIDAPRFEKVWPLPPSPDDKPGLMRAVAQEAG